MIQENTGINAVNLLIALLQFLYTIKIERKK